MAVTLPKREAGRASQRKQVRQSTAGDVRQVGVRQDPGIRVPAGAFGEQEGAALEQGGRAISQLGVDLQRSDAAAAKRLAAADARLKKRRSRNIRSVDKSDYEKLVSKDVEDFRKSADITDPRQLEAFGQTLRDRANKASDDHFAATEDPDSQVDFFDSAVSFNRTMFSALSKQSVAALKGKRDEIISGKQAEFRSTIVDNLSSFSEIVDASDKFLEEFDDEMGALEVRERKLQFRDDTAGDIIDRLIDTGKVDDADALLNDPNFQRLFIKDSTRVAFAKQITSLRNEPTVIVFDEESGQNILVPQSQSAGRRPEEKISKTEEISNNIALRNALVQNNPEDKEFIDSMFAKSGITINTGKEAVNVFSEGLQKLDVQTLTSIREKTGLAQETKSNVTRTLTVLESDRFQPGAGAGIRQAIGKIGELFGQDFSDIDIIGDPGAADILESSTKAMAFSLIDGLRSGRSSATLIRLAEDISPGLFRTVEGITIIAKIIDRQADRDIQEGQLAEEFIQEHGALTPPGKKSFFTEMIELEKRDPVINKELETLMREGLKEQREGKTPKSFKEVVDNLKGEVTEVTSEEIQSMDFSTAKEFINSGRDKNLSDEQKSELITILKKGPGAITEEKALPSGLEPLKGQKKREGKKKVKKGEFGLRPDGTKKGKGFLGLLKRPDGGVSSEISIGIELDGKEVLMPTLVPTLTKKEIKTLLNLPEGGVKDIPEEIIEKAVQHAGDRMRAGKSPFLEEGEK